MFPAAFQISHASGVEGVISGVLYHSMSLRNAVRRGYMPPLEILNLFTTCGYDDVDEDIGYMKGVPHDGPVINWDPFTLTEKEYGQLLSHIRHQYGDIRIDSFGAGTYEEWFTVCYRRSVKRGRG